MNKSQSTEIFVTQEELLRINYYASQQQRTSHKPRVHEPPPPDGYTFKPQINKKSKELERTVDDLLRWHERKSQKLQQIYDEKTNEIYQTANRLTHEPDKKLPPVFERLYVPRKSNEQPVQRMTSRISLENSKRNTDSQPFFAKNMTNSLFQEYQKRAPNTPPRLQTENPLPTDSPSQDSYAPCLPNRMYFDASKQPDLALSPEIEQPKVTTPQHMFVDFSEQIKLLALEPDPSPAKDPLNRKDVDMMVQRLNNWLAKKNQKILEQQSKNMQSQSQQCTFHPKLNKTPRTGQSIPAPPQQQQSPPTLSYSTLYQFRSQKLS